MNLQVNGTCAWLQGRTVYSIGGNSPTRCPRCGATAFIVGTTTMHGMSGERQEGIDCKCESCQSLTVVWGPVLYPPPVDPLEQMMIGPIPVRLDPSVPHGEIRVVKSEPGDWYGFNRSVLRDGKEVHEPMPPPDHRCPCGQAILPSRFACDRCQDRIDEAVAAAAAVKVTNEQIRQLAEKRRRPSVGDHYEMHQVTSDARERQRIVITGWAPTTDHAIVRLVSGDGSLSPPVKMESEMLEGPCSVLVDPIPTHEPTATRGRARLKPGVTL